MALFTLRVQTSAIHYDHPELVRKFSHLHGRVLKATTREAADEELAALGLRAEAEWAYPEASDGARKVWFLRDATNNHRLGNNSKLRMS